MEIFISTTKLSSWGMMRTIAIPLDFVASQVQGIRSLIVKMLIFELRDLIFMDENI